MADWNLHDEAGVKLLHEAGSDWAFYNGGNRWTYGVYMYKAAKQYGMKFRLSWHWNAVGRRSRTMPWTAARTTTPGATPAPTAS